MTFRDIHVHRAKRFAVGVNEETGECYVAIPVCNQTCDYEEFYRIDRRLVDDYPESMDDIIIIVDQCRRRELDHLLIFEPGRDRDEPS